MGDPGNIQENDLTTEIHEISVLIIGAGPAGSTAALLLARLGFPSIVISRHIGTANTPRAHLFNPRAMEVMRDAGIEKDLMDATPLEFLKHTSWLHSLAGEEYARMYFQGAGPDRKGEFEAASPCESVDLPQMRSEPILVKKAEEAGVRYWWYTEFVSQEEVEGVEMVETVLRDRKSGMMKRVRSKYLIGADGARSAVLDSLGIVVDGRQVNSVFNVHIKAELGRFFEVRPGVLNWILNPDAPEWSAVGNIRMVRPWSEFAVSMHPAMKDGQSFEPTHNDIRRRLYQMFGVGKDVVPEIEILSVSRWYVNDMIARSYQKGRVICIGDAVHRHPPINGLGSNTCVGDAMNLTWKLAYVLKGIAHPNILDTVTLERRPVGQQVVQRANEGMEEHRRLWSVIGLERDERREKLDLMATASGAGKALRDAWSAAVQATDREGNALGIQMNQRYCTSPLSVVEPNDTTAPEWPGVDLIMNLVVSTYPGYHLPHVWVARNGQSHRQSTLDLCGHGRFTIFTGIGGEKWRDYASKLNITRPCLDVVVVSIGWRQDYLDAYGDWTKIRGVDDDGAVLVRPDQFVAWRCKSISAVSSERLKEVFEQLLPVP